MRTARSKTFATLLFLAALCACLVVPHVLAQRVLEIRGFKFAEYYDAPQETKVKLRLQGAKAQPQGAGVVRVETARVETFRQDGRAELIVEAPQCIHNSTSHVISSSGPLMVKTEDGSFSIRGEGFLYQQTNATLFISNKVETTASPALLGRDTDDQSAPTNEGTPMLITADTFRYSADDSAGLYSGNVKVTGTNLALASGRLALKLPIDERKLHEITAEENVVLDYEQMHAKGNKAIYNVDSEVAKITGNPTWSSEGREGRAEAFTIDRTNRLVIADGNAWLRMPGQSLAENMLPDLDPSRNAQAEQGPKAVEVSASRYDLHTNHIVFHDGVLVREFIGDQEEGKLSCREMTVHFEGTNQLQKLTADRNVLIERGEARFRADRAIYTGVDKLLQLRESPSWEAGARRGSGETIDVDGTAREMQVRGNSVMRLPSESMGDSVRGRPLGAVQTTQTGTNEMAEIFAQSYSVRAEQAIFTGSVRVNHPQMNWTCERLAVDLPPENEHVEKVLAEQGVNFTLVDRSGQEVKGKAEVATYTYDVSQGITNEQMRLTGDPFVQTTNGTFRNAIIIYDLVSNKVMGPGRHFSHGTAPAIQTNQFKSRR